MLAHLVCIHLGITEVLTETHPIIFWVLCLQVVSVLPNPEPFKVTHDLNLIVNLLQKVLLVFTYT